MEEEPENNSSVRSTSCQTTFPCICLCQSRQQGEVVNPSDQPLMMATSKDLCHFQAGQDLPSGPEIKPMQPNNDPKFCHFIDSEGNFFQYSLPSTHPSLDPRVPPGRYIMDWGQLQPLDSQTNQKQPQNQQGTQPQAKLPTAIQSPTKPQPDLARTKPTEIVTMPRPGGNNIQPSVALSGDTQQPTARAAKKSAMLQFKTPQEGKRGDDVKKGLPLQMTEKTPPVQFASHISMPPANVVALPVETSLEASKVILYPSNSETNRLPSEKSMERSLHGTDEMVTSPRQEGRAWNPVQEFARKVITWSKTSALEQSSYRSVRGRNNCGFPGYPGSDSDPMTGGGGGFHAGADRISAAGLPLDLRPIEQLMVEQCRTLGKERAFTRNNYQGQQQPCTAGRHQRRPLNPLTNPQAFRALPNGELLLNTTTNASPADASQVLYEVV